MRLVQSPVWSFKFYKSITLTNVGYCLRRDPGVESAFNRNEYQESSWGKGLPARKAHNLTVICEPIV
jgi:hypothetical protein